MTSGFHRGRLLLGWRLCLLLFPLLWWQGRRTRQRTPRLPEAAGPRSGIVPGVGPALRLVVLGESPVAGVGVAHQDEGLVAQLARELARRKARTVHWHALGENGIRLRELRERLLPQVAPLAPDFVVVAMGVNDTTGLTPRRRWRRDLARLVAELRRYSDCPVLFASVPPMASFTALPQPLRGVLALRAHLLDAELRAFVACDGRLQHAPPLPLLPPEYLSADGYHPSAAGVRAWAEQLAGCR